MVVQDRQPPKRGESWLRRRTDDRCRGPACVVLALLLRQRYVETRGKHKVLHQLISASLPTFIFVFKGLLYLLGKEIPETKSETVSTLSTELKLDGELFASLLQIESGTLKSSPAEIEDLFRRYLKEIRRLALLMDSDVFGEL